MAKKPETVFKERVARDLKTLPYTWFVKIQQVSIRGIPDFILCVKGRFVALELKKSKNDKPNPLQEWTLQCIGQSEGLALIACPENWPNTFTLLKDLATDEIEEAEEEMTEEELEQEPEITEPEEVPKKRH